jgi:hypothetical protein
MNRLYATIAMLVLFWSVAMSFFALSAYKDDWTWSIVGVIALVFFAGLGGLSMPRARAAATEEDRKSSFWMLQFFGSLITTEFLLAALIAWIMGNRTHHSSNAYQTLGLIIFLTLLAVGPGIIVTYTIFLARRSELSNEARRNLPIVAH